MAKYLIIAVAFCILGACLSKVAMDPEQVKAFMDVAEACKAEVGASQSDIDDVVAKNPAASKEGKCMRACVLQKFGVMDAAGNLVQEVALEHAKKFIEDPEMLKMAAEVLAECATKTVPGDQCESAEAYKSCIKTAAVAHGVDCEF